MRAFVLLCVVLFAGITAIPRGYASPNFKLPAAVSSAASEKVGGLVAKRGMIRKLLLAGTLALGVTVTTCIGGCQHSRDTEAEPVAEVVTEAEVEEQLETDAELAVTEVDVVKQPKADVEEQPAMVGSEISSLFSDVLQKYLEFGSGGWVDPIKIIELLPNGHIISRGRGTIGSPNYIPPPIPPGYYVERVILTNPPIYYLAPITPSRDTPPSTPKEFLQPLTPLDPNEGMPLPLDSNVHQLLRRTPLDSNVHQLQLDSDDNGSFGTEYSDIDDIVDEITPKLRTPAIKIW